MEIRRATINDMEAINKLLCQVLEIHHTGRPDIFKSNTKKYTDDELRKVIADDEKPIFIAEIEEEVVGYAFCIFQQYKENNILTDIKTLYIDDLCVDENKRGMQIGRKLYEYVLEFAKKSGCYNVTLNVWECNKKAKGFYENLGMEVQKTYMEKVL